MTTTGGRQKREPANFDLWQRLGQLLEARRPGEVVFTKVKGHASASDVEAGRSEPFDKHGNDEADDLAVAGALCHAVQPRQQEALRWRIGVARDVQTLMVEILSKRASVLQASSPPTGRQVARQNEANRASSSTDSSSSSSSSAGSSYAASSGGRGRGKGRSRGRGRGGRGRGGRRGRGRSSPAAPE